MTTTPTREELERPEVIAAEHAIVDCLYRYIDRMNDVCEEDPADRIIGQFTTAIDPLIEAHILAIWGGDRRRLASNHASLVDAADRAEYARLYAKFGGVKP